VANTLQNIRIFFKRMYRCLIRRLFLATLLFHTISALWKIWWSSK